jgi:nitroimidazol reductase NimA-like FMN-containing flavoprotein (pyridoxamine 5'-phosphate oxidase superfamily)
MTSIEDRGGLEIIFEDECRRLLQPGGVGRIAVVDHGQPLVFPVNYAFDGPDIVFRTAPGTKLDAARGALVAFEIDGYDMTYRTGWSVLVQGRAEEVRDAAERSRLATLPLRPWARGSKPQWVRIRPTLITGRRIPELTPTRRTDGMVVEWAIS